MVAPNGFDTSDMESFHLRLSLSGSPDIDYIVIAYEINLFDNVTEIHPQC